MDSFDPPVATLRALLTLIRDEAGASTGAVFAPRGKGLALLAQRDIDQKGLDLAHACWARRRREVNAGQVVLYGCTVLWPLFDGPELVALIYLDRAREGFPNDACRQDAARLVRSLNGVRATSPAVAYLNAAIPMAEAANAFQADQLAIALQTSNGSVAGAARLLNVTRETVYERVDRFGLELESFRPKRRGHRRE